MTQAMDAVTRRVLERLGERPVEDEKIYNEELRYCWVDEDDRRVSPVHKDFGKALSWISNWPDVVAQLQMWGRKNEGRNHPYYSDESIQKLERAVSLTGKPPTKLKRVVIRTVGEPIADYEQMPVDAAMKNAGLIS